MKKIYFTFLILFFVFSSLAEDWKPDEWLFAKPVFLPRPTKEESNKINEATKQKELFPWSFYKKMFLKLPEKFELLQGAKIITPFGTTSWEKVGEVGECPAIEESIPESSVFFAAKYWVSTEKQDADLWFASSDAVKIWQNGKEIFNFSQNRPYRSTRKSFVKTELKKGTNIFVFSVINGEGFGMVGARLYPKKSAIYPGLFLETTKLLETKKFVKLDFYWVPSAIIKPRKKGILFKNHCVGFFL